MKQNFTQKNKNKQYWTVKAVGPEWTDERTHESEFIGSHSDKSGEPTKSNKRAMLISHKSLVLDFLAILSLIFFLTLIL